MKGRRKKRRCKLPELKSCSNNRMRRYMSESGGHGVTRKGKSERCENHNA